MDKLKLEELPNGAKIWRIARFTARPNPEREGDWVAELAASPSDLTIKPKVEEALGVIATMVVAQQIYDDPIGHGIAGYAEEALNCTSIDRAAEVIEWYLHEHEAWKLQRRLKKNRGH